uniref:transcriptional regulator n=1 Tax=Gelidibacter sp. TaxID=2018083 RepID=UPI004049430A
MISIITGDIIKSRTEAQPEVWLMALKHSLETIAESPKHWELYRGDSFQLEINSIEDSFKAAMYIKACIKTIKGLDVRLAIGVGSKSFEGQTILESNGEAFQFSGETLETLKIEKQNLKIKTKDNVLNEELNLYFKLALISMDVWTTNSAEMVKLCLENPNALQMDLAKILGINQDAVSKRMKRANLDELLELDTIFRKKITTLR